MRLFLTILFLISNFVFANVIDSPGGAGAESCALSGAGISYLGGMAGATNNPAGLAKIKKYNFEVSSTLLFISKSAPVNAANTLSSSFTFAPPIFFGFGYRINEYFSTGFGFDTTAAGGTTYPGINFGIPGLEPRELYLSSTFFEFGPYLAVNLPHNINIGFQYRIDYAKQNLKMYDVRNAGSGIITYNNASLSGWGFTGIKIGIQYKPIERLSFGLTYRSPIKIGTSGSMSVYDVGTATTANIDITSRLKFADRLLFGTAYELIEKIWTVAFDFEYNLYSNYYSTDLITPLGTTQFILSYKNRQVYKIGTEYKLTPAWALRGGFSYFTTYENANFFNATNIGAPGPAVMFSLGFGHQISEKWILNFAYNLLRNKASIATPAPSAASTSGVYTFMLNFFTIDLLYNL